MMKKSFMLLAIGLSSLNLYAQDDDVYFVPSSQNDAESSDTYVAPRRSSYAPLDSDGDVYSFDSWADGRTRGGRDIDAYNRRGHNYKSGVQADSAASAQQLYDEGYEDGYEDGSCTARLVRFWSPRAGVYVSSPYYIDYFDLCYDPWYYGYSYSPWAWSWNSWWGWGSWYGWHPWHAAWDWYGSHYAWGGWHGGWHPDHWGFDGGGRGWRGGVAYSGSRPAGSAGFSRGRSFASNGSRAVQTAGQYRGAGRVFGNTARTGSSRSFNQGNSSRVLGKASGVRSARSLTSSRSLEGSNSSSRSFVPSRSGSSANTSRSFSSSSHSYSTPSRSFSAPSRGGGFSGGHMGGGGRSFGGRR